MCQRNLLISVEYFTPFVPICKTNCYKCFMSSNELYSFILSTDIF